jgi:hypothetical protein
MISGEILELMERIPEEVRCRRHRYVFVDRVLADMVGHDEPAPIIVYGRRGAGKSTFAFKAVAQYLMQYEGMECGEAYHRILTEFLTYHPRDFIERLGSYRQAVLWDDAGQWLSTYFWYDPELRPYLIAVVNWFDTSRSDLGSILFTTPTPKKLPPKIREDVEVVMVRVRRAGMGKNGFKVAKAHTVVFEESEYSGSRYVKLELSDYFEVRLPDPVYRVYKPIRDAYHRMATEILKRVLARMGGISYPVGSEDTNLKNE